MLLSALLENENINAPLFAFFNTRTIRNKDFANTFMIRSLYQYKDPEKIKDKDKKFNYVILNENEKEKMAKETNENLSNYSNLEFHYEKFGSHRVLIENDLKLSQDEYWKKLYNRINFLAYGGGVTPSLMRVNF